MKPGSFTLTAILLLLAGCLQTHAQVSQDDDELWFYRIWFKDKGSVAAYHSPDELLSPAAIARREKYDIQLADNDIPVNSQYVSALTQSGLRLRSTSRWLNTALFTSITQKSAEELGTYSFIDSIQPVRTPSDPVKKSRSKFGITWPIDDPMAFDPRVPLNAVTLHQSGLTGRNVTIAVLDAGFAGADVIESLVHLRQRGGITATRNFVDGTDDVYDYHTHGTSVLSILAGSLPGIINGTATGADYLLLRTEDDLSEYPVEEDYWVAAAEYADSAGADIITSSLGYSTFDDSSLNYSFSDLDGNSAFITRAADIAASKGILVVNSAGNERNKEWIRILAPSDGDSVLCVGAVRYDLTISDFSSAGFSSDGQVKPDVVAPGVAVPVQFEPGYWHAGSGTSFSCPVISGLCASLMQAVPEASPMEIIDALHRSSDRFSQPDSLYGYGLPDLLQALPLLEEQYTWLPPTMMTAGPNPFTDGIKFWFHAPPGRLNVKVTGLNGMTMLERDYPVYIARSFRLDGLGHLSQGICFVKVTTSYGERTFKMIRVSR
jgi:hypothetical protein